MRAHPTKTKKTTTNVLRTSVKLSAVDLVVQWAIDKSQLTRWLYTPHPPHSCECSPSSLESWSRIAFVMLWEKKLEVERGGCGYGGVGAILRTPSSYYPSSLIHSKASPTMTLPLPLPPWPLPTDTPIRVQRGGHPPPPCALRAFLSIETSDVLPVGWWWVFLLGCLCVAFFFCMSVENVSQIASSRM